MKNLPFELQRPFFTLIIEQGDLKRFETWLYQTSSLENYLRSNDYFELISLDFNHKFCVMEIEKIITPYLDYLQYNRQILLDILLSLTQNPNDLTKLRDIYHFYEQGYAFLDKLADGYGSSAEICYLDDLEWILSKGHLEKIKKLAQAYYDDLVSHKIILLKSPNGYDYTGYYQDNRRN